MLYYILPPFTILKSLYSTSQLACFKKIISVQVWGYLAQRSYISKALIDLSSNKSDNRDHKNSLGSNKLEVSEASIGSYEALAKSLQALLLKAKIDVTRFIPQKDLD